MRASAAAAAAILLALAGCRGEDAPERRREASATAREVAAVVRTLERATARGDWRTICDRVFSGAVRAQAGGDRCPAMLRRTARGVRDPRIEIVEIRVRGRRATARVRTTARGQAPARDVIQLVREDGAWRVAALGEG